MRDTRIALFGCGPHAKRIYIPYMTSRSLEPKIIVDVESKRSEIVRLISEKEWHTVFVGLQPKSAYEAFSRSEKRFLIKALTENKINKALISTSPEVHVPFARLALSFNISVLMDKPLSAPKNVVCGNSKQILKDLRVLIKAKGDNQVVIQCQRRRHAGYVYVKSLISEMKQKYGVCPHYIDIYHSDGRWDFPDEILLLTNHPYKSGYGKLFHSGYHFVDLYNFLTDGVEAKTYKLITYKIDPNDFCAQVNRRFYERTFGQKIQNIEFNECGEIDNHTLIQLMSDGRVLSTGSINLLHSGYTKRSWYNAKADLYKGNGRLRHERVNIQIGPLMNIQVHSYQSSEVHDTQNINSKEFGGLEHFDIHIFRNTELISGRRYELIHLSDIENVKDIGQNEHARYSLVDDFIAGVKTASDLEAQVWTNKMMAAISKSMYTGKEVRGCYERDC